MKRIILSFLFLVTACSVFAVGENGWFDNGGSGGGLSQGAAISGGTKNGVLYENGSGVLKTSSNFLFNDQTTVLTLTGATIAGNMTFSGSPAFNGGASFTGNNNLINITSNTITWNPPDNTNDIFKATGSFSNADGEQELFRFVGQTQSTSTTQLSSTIWAFMLANSSGTVTTAHEGAIFGRAIKGTLSQTFSFGVEGNCWSNTILGGGVSTTGACVGVIGHSVWEGAAISTPTAPIIGTDLRAEITDPTITTNRTGTDLQFDIIGARVETYGGVAVTTATRNYSLYAAVGGSAIAKLVNNGPIMGLPAPVQTISSGNTILSDACGSVKQITASGAVSTDATNTFSPPSISTAGTANTGCFQYVVNTGANTITLKNNATFLTYAGEDINLNTAAAVPVFGNGSNWVQAGPVVNTSLAAVYVSSVTASSSTATTGTYGNHGVVTLTPGDWDVTASCSINANGATITSSTMAISINSGNTTTDQVNGNNQIPTPLATSSINAGQVISAYRIATAASQTVFVKLNESFSVATPTAACRISARRIN